MKSALIGFTGFVGSNLNSQFEFSNKYNSKNIAEIAQETFDLVVCAGVRAEMWIANQDPAGDLARIQELMDHLATVKAKQFVLISTVGVYTHPTGVDEDSDVDIEHATPYGVNRRKFEEFCSQRFDNCLIVRLPGLFGEGIKKNVIYDFMNNNNVDRIDARAVYQFYDLGRIWRDIQTALDNNLLLVNFATAPTTVAEVAKGAFGLDFSQETLPSDKLPQYDMHTKYSKIYGGTGHYLLDKQGVLDGIQAFVEAHKAAKS